MLANYEKTLAFVSLSPITIATLFFAPGLAYEVSQ
jgi:hypothetical protein